MFRKFIFQTERDSITANAYPVSLSWLLFPALVTITDDDWSNAFRVVKWLRRTKKGLHIGTDNASAFNICFQFFFVWSQYCFVLPVHAPLIFAPTQFAIDLNVNGDNNWQGVSERWRKSQAEWCNKRDRQEIINKNKRMSTATLTTAATTHHRFTSKIWNQ